MKTETCAVCGTGALAKKKGNYETRFPDRGGRVHYLSVPDVEWLECESCGEAILDDVASRKLEAARRRAMALLAPEEIRLIRQRLGMTQTEISNLLGIGEKTYCRWETGAYIQSVALDNYLRIVSDLPSAVEFLYRIRAGASRDASELSVSTTFTYLNDSPALMESAEIFTTLLEGGQLLAARIAN